MIETDSIRRSLEVEYWVIDGDGELVEPVLEVKTTPCDSSASLRTELLERLRDVLQKADEIAEIESDRPRI